MNVYIECGGSLTLKDRDTGIIEKKDKAFIKHALKEMREIVWFGPLENKTYQLYG